MSDDHNLKILIVEDIAITRKVHINMLTFLGKCEQAEDGMTAVRKFMEAHEDKTPFDLICLDIMLPQLSGIEVLKRIRKFENQNKIEKSDKVKIVMVTTLNDQKMVLEAARSGCDSYLKKPLIKQKLVEEITRLGLIPA